ncbi:hypothetical protein D9M68_685660 [compost metagenome]
MRCTQPNKKENHHVPQEPDPLRLRPRPVRRHPPRGPAPGRPYRADRLGELHQPAGDAGPGQRADQQVRRRLPGQALLRWLRVRRQGRAAGHRPRQAAVRRRLRQRPAALRLPGQQRRLPGPAERRRHHPRHEPGPRRPPDPRRQGVVLRQAVQRRAVRPGYRHRPDRLRRSRAPGRGAQAEDDRRRLLRLLQDPRLPALPRHRRQGRCLALCRHGACRRAGRRRPVPEPAALRRRGHHHHPQDPARSAWRPDPGQGQP